MIAKADTMIPDELREFKSQIMNQLVQAKIKIYNFPGTGSENIVNFPFATVGSNCIIEEGGKKFRGRRYPWGVVNVRT